MKYGHVSVAVGKDQFGRPVRSVKGRTLKHRKPKPKRNEPCPCGSGYKYKACCLLRI